MPLRLNHPQTSLQHGKQAGKSGQFHSHLTPNLPKKLTIRMIPHRLCAILSIQDYPGGYIKIPSLRKQLTLTLIYATSGIPVRIKLRAVTWLRKSELAYGE
ncbi:hypothetical protein HGRIS_013990 [Hohenbuehelia grisea]|uniref:Uncharacterized protein n=1 Tax=Hohenbuehelia grisea TaxID=104357 RepID=A0ABR3JTP1_9AGAR